MQRCFMHYFKQPERNKLGIIIKSKYEGKTEQKVVIACADDADFCTSGENSEIKLHEIFFA